MNVRGYSRAGATGTVGTVLTGPLFPKLRPFVPKFPEKPDHY